MSLLKGINGYQQIAKAIFQKKVLPYFLLKSTSCLVELVVGLLDVGSLMAALLMIITSCNMSWLK